MAKITEEQKITMNGKLAKAHLNTAKNLLTLLREKETTNPILIRPLLDEAKTILLNVYNTHKDI